MSKRILLSVACLFLLAGIALAAGAPPVPDPPAFLSVEGPACQAEPGAAELARIGFRPVFKGHDPATCWKCLNCTSANVCAGKLIGDACSGTGGTCQAFDGCALYNCCRCANIQPVGVAASAG